MISLQSNIRHIWNKFNKFFYILISVILSSAATYFLTTHNKDVDTYTTNSILARPYLQIKKPVIDSIVFYYDSTAILDYLATENSLMPRKTMHEIIPSVTIFYHVIVLNKANFVLYRFGECVTDSFATEYLLRDKLFDPQIEFTESENPFGWNKLGPLDSNRISFNQNIYFPVGRPPFSKFALHLNILYESEYDVLFDSYFLGKYSFEYPDNLLVTKRAPFRIFQKGYFRVRGDKEKVKLYFGENDTKIYSYKDAMFVFQKANYYHQKYTSIKEIFSKKRN